MTTKKDGTTGLADRIEERAQQIKAGRDRTETERQLDQDRGTATRELRREQIQTDRQNLAYCQTAAARRGVRLVADVWKGAPCDPGLSFRPNPRNVYDPEGVHIITADRNTVFVCSPAVNVGARRVALHTAGKWKTVDLPGDRKTTAEHDLQALADAGLRVGRGDVLLERDSEPVAVSVIALEWIFGKGRGGSIICGPRPVVSLWDVSPSDDEVEYVSMTTAEKQSQGEVMQRYPAEAPFSDYQRSHR